MNSEYVESIVAEFSPGAVSCWERKNLAGKTLDGLKSEALKAMRRQFALKVVYWIATTITFLATVSAAFYFGIWVFPVHIDPNHMRPNFLIMTLAIVSGATIMVVIVTSIANRNHRDWFVIESYNHALEKFEKSAKKLVIADDRDLTSELLKTSVLFARASMLASVVLEDSSRFKTIRLDPKAGPTDVIRAGRRLTDNQERFDRFWSGLEDFENVDQHNKDIVFSLEKARRNEEDKTPR
ncbi:MAG: hypothetical protein WC648_02495 [Candidatus Paceibacterota bacterium]|jgi:hypothetical protein